MYATSGVFPVPPSVRFPTLITGRDSRPVFTHPYLYDAARIESPRRNAPASGCRSAVTTRLRPQLSSIASWSLARRVAEGSSNHSRRLGRAVKLSGVDTPRGRSTHIRSANNHRREKLLE